MVIIAINRINRYFNIIFYRILYHLTSACSPNLSSIHLIVIDPGLSIGKPKALDHTKLAMHPRALDTAKTAV